MATHSSIGCWHHQVVLQTSSEEKASVAGQMVCREWSIQRVGGKEGGGVMFVCVCARVWYVCAFMHSEHSCMQSTACLACVGVHAM